MTTAPEALQYATFDTPVHTPVRPSEIRRQVTQALTGGLIVTALSLCGIALIAGLILTSGLTSGLKRIVQLLTW
jgi:hypothetical protein